MAASKKLPLSLIFFVKISFITNTDFKNILIQVFQALIVTQNLKKLLFYISNYNKTVQMCIFYVH